MTNTTYRALMVAIALAVTPAGALETDKGTDGPGTPPPKYNKADPNLKHGKNRPKSKTEAKSGAGIPDEDLTTPARYHRYIEDAPKSNKKSSDVEMSR